MLVNQYKIVLDKETRLNLLVEEYQFESLPDVSISNPQATYEFMEDTYALSSECTEKVYLLCFNSKNNLIGVFRLSEGTVNKSFLSPREVLVRALLINSPQIVIIHNHPSGDATPSKEDIFVTKTLREAAELIGISLVDHIIIGDDFVSLKEYGHL